jgi:hypothetical protein
VQFQNAGIAVRDRGPVVQPQVLRDARKIDCGRRKSRAGRDL